MGIFSIISYSYSPLYKDSVDESKSVVLLASMKKISKIKESSKNVFGMNQWLPEESIDAGKGHEWRSRLPSGANDSIAYGVGESIMKPHKLDESNAIFTLNMNKDYKKRVRKVDVERQQMEMMNRQADEVLVKTGVEMRQLEEAQKTMIQGHQGATQESKNHNHGGDSIATIPKSSEHNVENAIPKSAFVKIE
jgi:hypothetical protein